jgi:CheY-like chemotaxis protein
MPYRLLLADDSVTIQRVIELTFADEDIGVTAVGDGQQAMDQILANRPDIVLADVGMPKHDGYEVAAFIKDDPSLQHIPVLLLTGAFEPVDEERAKAVRCNGVLAKPFEPQLLIGRVKELLRGVVPAAASPAPGAVEPQPGVVVPVLAEAPLASVPDVASASIDYDEDATVRMPRPPLALPEEETRLDVAALELKPEPASAPEGTLDDYFDRLDAAFAHLTGGQAGREARPPGQDPWIAAVKPRTSWPAPPEDEAADLAARGLDPDRVRPEVVGPGPGEGATSSPAEDLDAVASRIESKPAVALPVSEAFAALLDAEHERGPQQVHRPRLEGGASIVLPGTVATTAFIDDVARRVFERLGEPALRGVVSQVVSEAAERLIREEIERLKAQVR